MSCFDFLHELCGFRTLNHKLPIESDRWQNLEIKRRICDMLEKNETEEEFHVNVYRLACNILDSGSMLVINILTPFTEKGQILLNLMN